MGKALRVKRQPTPLIDEDILRAAEILEREALCLKESNAAGKQLWIGDCAKDRDDHEEMRRIARRLRRVDIRARAAKGKKYADLVPGLKHAVSILFQNGFNKSARVIEVQIELLDAADGDLGTEIMSKPIRVQLSRRKGWRMPPNTVKVSRPSGWGNPIRIGDCCHIEGCDGRMYDFPVTPEIAVSMYQEYVARRLHTNCEWLKPLRGKNVACWCPLDRPCHAEVLLELANR